MFSFFSHVKLTISKIFDGIQLFKLFLCSLLLTCLLTANTFALESNDLKGTSLSLFGIAVHSELRNEIYVGAMFAPAEIDDYKLLYNASITKNMSLRFIQGYSKRKIARLWKQRIAMNNEKLKWQPLTKDIIRFAKIFKRSMQVGDEINLIYVPNEGTKIYLNSSLFFVVQNPEFYNVLLNTWYGSVPPSKLFKTGITGKNTDYLQKKIITQYESLISIPGRFDTDKSKTVSTKGVRAKKESSVSKEVVKKAISVNKAIIKSQESSTQSLVDAFKPNLQNIVTSKDKTVNVVVQITLFITNLELSEMTIKNIAIKPIDLSQPVIPSINETNRSPVQDSQPSQPNEKELNVVLTKPAPTEDLVNNLKESSINDNFINNDLVASTYTKNLVEFVKRSQKYPKKAFQRNHEGNLIISLTISPVGDIINLSMIQRSGSIYLDRGVLKQVRAIEPFPPIPASLNLESYNVEIPMSFSFSK